MDPKHKSVSLAEQVFEKLEQEILCGKYQRGEILTELKLSEELGVSRTPIREALRRLSQEHIIEDTFKGSLVIGISAEDVKDIFRIRKLIEGFAAEGAAKNITAEQLSELKEILELQEFYIERENVDNIRVMDSRFHEMVYRSCGSSVLYDTLVPLHRKTQKYRRASVSDHTKAQISFEEHRKIFNAIAEHNTEKALLLATEHVENAEKRILNGGEN